MLALESAISFGVDAAVMPISTKCGALCSSTINCSGLNETLEDAQDAGILLAVSSGNSNDDQGMAFDDSCWTQGTCTNQNILCNVDYPAHRPETLSVGAVGRLETTLPYFFESLADYSSRGWIIGGRGGSLGGADRIPAVSIVAPGWIEEFMTEGPTTFQENSGDPQWDDPSEGTSFSAPIVGGAATLFRQWQQTFDPSKATSAKYLRAATLAMGNGAGARTVATGWRSGVSPEWGTGKLLAQPLHTIPGVGWKNYALNSIEGWTLQTVLPALGANTTVLKVASYIETSDLTQVPHIFLIIRDGCDGNKIVAYDFYFAFEKFIKITKQSILQGMCPVIELYGYSVPSGGAPVYTMAYWTSDDPNEH